MKNSKIFIWAIILSVIVIASGVNVYFAENISQLRATLFSIEALTQEGPSHCPNFIRTYKNFGTVNNPIWLTCCLTGTDMDACAFPNEDSSCSQHATRPSHSHCQ
jgi:hypothetical protein